MSRRRERIVVLTGAGISAESGLCTFRAADGLWENRRIADFATPEGFARNPTLVHRFYNERRSRLAKAEPNAAHIALSDFENGFGGEFLLVTQNIDDLHERGGSRSPLHMHGELLKKECAACGEVSLCISDIDAGHACESCRHTGGLRPHIVWFGEQPLCMERIENALARCDLFVAIGTSGIVYPAAGFAALAKEAGARCVELNLEPTSSELFDERRIGPATEAVPQFMQSLLDGI